MNKLILSLFICILLIGNVSAISSGESTLLFGSIFSMLAIVAFFLVLSLSAITIVLTVGIGVTIINEFFTTFSTLLITYGAFYRALTILLIGGGLALIVYLIVVALRSFDSYRGLIDPVVPGA